MEFKSDLEHEGETAVIEPGIRFCSNFSDIGVNVNRAVPTKDITRLNKSLKVVNKTIAECEKRSEAHKLCTGRCGIARLKQEIMFHLEQNRNDLRGY